MQLSALSIAAEILSLPKLAAAAQTPNATDRIAQQNTVLVHHQTHLLPCLVRTP